MTGGRIVDEDQATKLLTEAKPLKVSSKIREHIRKEFVESGFIEVYQWRNFVDYLTMLIEREKELAIQEYLAQNKDGLKQKVLELIEELEEKGFHRKDKDERLISYWFTYNEMFRFKKQIKEI